MQASPVGVELHACVCAVADLSLTGRSAFKWAAMLGSCLRRPSSGSCGVAQVRDEYRTDWDAGRGGYGNIVKQELTSRQAAVAEQMGMYEEGQGGEEAPMNVDSDAVAA